LSIFVNLIIFVNGIQRINVSEPCMSHVNSCFFFLFLEKLSMCHVNIVSCVNVSTTCEFVVVLFSFVQFSPYIGYFSPISSLYSLFFLVPILVKMKQFCSFQIDTKFNVFINIMLIF